MRILFTSVNSLDENCSASVRNQGLLRGLHELGHTVDVLCPAPFEKGLNADASLASAAGEHAIHKTFWIPGLYLYTALRKKKCSTPKELDQIKQVMGNDENSIGKYERSERELFRLGEKSGVGNGTACPGTQNRHVMSKAGGECTGIRSNNGSGFQNHRECISPSVQPNLRKISGEVRCRTPRGGGGSDCLNLKSLLKKLFYSIFLYEPQGLNIQNLRLVEGINFSDYDLIISSSDPKASHRLGEEVKKRAPQAKWVQYWGDPMLLDMTKHFTGLRKIRVRREEARLLSMADGVLYVSPFTMQVQKETFPDAAAKMFWVNQAAMPAERLITPNRGNVPADIFSIGYFGQYTDAIRNMHPLYQAVTEMQGIHLTIGGAGDVEFPPAKQATILGKLPYTEVLEREAGCDAVICVCNRSGTQIPGKVYYSAASSKPVIVVLDGEKADEMEDYFRQFDRFILCRNCVDDIKKALQFAKEQVASGRTYLLPEQLRPEFVGKRFLECAGMMA